MTIHVSSKVKDENTGARVVQVRLSSSNSFETPTRSLTSTEHNYQVETMDKIVSSLGLGQGPSIAFENQIVQASKNHDLPQLQRFLKQNGVFHQAQRSVTGLVNAYPNKFIIYYPAFTAKMLYEENNVIGVENLKTLVDFQVNCNLKNVSIPESHPNQSFEHFQQDLNALSKRAFAYGADIVIPYLDMGMENDLFEVKYEHLIDCGFPIIGAAYRKYSEHYPNYRFLQQRDDDVLLVCSGVDRYWRSNYTTSFMHVPNFWGFDITSLYARSAPPKMDKFGNVIRKSIDEVKRFNADCLGLVTLSSHEKMYGTGLRCECPVCQGKDITQFKQEFSVDSKGNRGSHILDKFCKVHEIYASTSEFTNERQYIKQNDSKAYIDSHEFLKVFFDSNSQ